MGVWGTGLYENDMAQDVFHAFKKKQLLLHSAIEAGLRTEMEFAEEIQDFVDGPIITAVIADQLSYSVSSKNSFAQKTISWIDSGGDLNLWSKSSPKAVDMRRKELLELRNRLVSGYQLDNNQQLYHRKQFQWSPQQVYAFPLQSKKSIELGLDGEYLLFYILGPAPSYDGYRIPRAWTKLSKNGVLPRNADEFNQLEFIQIACTEYADRFGPFSHEDKVPEWFRQQYQCDMWGYLPEFTAELVQANGCHPPKEMVLLGTFEGVTAPEYEYHRYRSCLGHAWKFAEELFLRDYQLHNLHQAAIYNRKPSDSVK